MRPAPLTSISGGACCDGMKSSSDGLPWRWLFPGQPDHSGPPWPAAESAPEFTDPEPFAEAGANSISVLVIVGWRQGAGRWLYADQRLSCRDILWLMRPGHLAQAAEELGECAPQAANLTVGVYRDVIELAPLARAAGRIWSLAVLDADPSIGARMRTARTGLLHASQFKVGRILEDLPRVVANADRLQHAVPLAALRKACEGRTALCVAAGPGLDDQIDLLRQAHADAVVIACDVVAARLEAAGIRVDVVMNVDSHAEIAKRIGRLANPETLLITGLAVHPDLAEAFPRIAFDEMSFGGQFAFRERTVFPRGTNVGAATVGLASFLGCAEIVLAGHDLSFTREQAYSRMVADSDRFAEFNFASLIASGQVYEIPGNADGPVLTDMTLGLGVDELAMLIRRMPDVAVYNLNMTSRRGACIPGARKLPEGWRPRPGSGRPLPLPQAGAGAANLMERTSRGMREAVLRTWRGWRDRAAGQLATDPVAFFTACETDGTLAPAWEIAQHAVAGYVLQAARLASQPAHQARMGARRAIMASLIDSLPVLDQAIEAAVDGRYHAPLIEPDPTFEAFRAEFSACLPVLPPDSFSGAVSQVACMHQGALLSSVSQVRLPPPVSVHDAVLRLAGCWQWLDAEARDEALACCWLEPQTAGYLLDIARRHGRLPQAALADPSQEWGGTLAMRAASALARLPDAPPAAVEALARTAVAWTPAHGILVERLCRLPAGAPVVGRLIEEGQLPVDDGLAADLLRLHPDPMAAIHLLEPYEDRLGAATTVAMAAKHLALREFPLAERHAARVPAIDALAEEALGIQLAAILAERGPAEMHAAAQSFPRPALRNGGMYLAIRHIAGTWEAWNFIAQNHLVPVAPHLIAAAMQECMTSSTPVDRLSACRLLGRIAADSRSAGGPAAWDADLATLVAAAEAMPAR